MSLAKIFSVLFLLGTQALGTDSRKVRFFRDVNYNGLLGEFDATPSCQNLLSGVNDRTVSIQTEVCIMAYEHGDCTGRSIKVTPEGTAGGTNGANLANLQFGAFDHVISAFHECTEREGGHSVFVDLFRKRHFEEPEHSFSHVCGCVNLPNDHCAVGSLNNHGNCVRVFFDSHCRGMFATFRAGQTEFSQDTEIFATSIGNLTKDVKWMSSLEPCFVPASCL